MDKRNLGSSGREKMALKNGSHAAFHYTNGDRYVGDWKDGCREGRGIHFYKRNGKQYIGEWKNDSREGHGILSGLKDSKLTKLYVGNWKDDKKDGLGSYFYSSSSSYEGQWSNDFRQGWGKMTYEDGSVYEGEWRKGSRHGKGTHLLANGDKYEGMWEKDEKEGSGTFTFLSKRQFYNGEWSKGQARCGTIHNLPPLEGQPGTLYPIPVIGLENPQGILDTEKRLLSDCRRNQASNINAKAIY